MSWRIGSPAPPRTTAASMPSRNLKRTGWSYERAVRVRRVVSPRGTRTGVGDNRGDARRRRHIDSHPPVLGILPHGGRCRLVRLADPDIEPRLRSSAVPALHAAIAVAYRTVFRATEPA